ncbi:hypothetical protein J2Y63_006134 [Shinella sp. BE166]|uniref:hypothetical protein n=1 Tax=unclassified Shinella TaxID=2643062 RepID=UPI003EBE371D
MNRIIPAMLACCAPILLSTGAHASEEQFLGGLEGQYAGQGQVRLRTNKEPINVDCTFTSTASGNSLSLKGRCRGLLVVSRAVGVDLKISGGAYRGSYIGAGSGPASLSGKRRGDTLNLAIGWAKEVNGDRRASLSVAKAGNDGLTLTTTDRDPASGKTVTTSRITLQRQ